MFDPMMRALTLVLVLFCTAPLAQELSDPTRPKQARAASAQAQAETRVTRYSLESTLVSDSRRIAVINGVSVAQGESVAGANVARIAGERVLLEINGTTRTLVLDAAPAIRR